jgi:hypothetical protein
MAILFFAGFGTAIVAAMLIAAANAFTICVAVPAWRRYSILAPVSALIITGFCAAPLGFLILQLNDHMFIFGERFRGATLLAILLSILAFSAVCALAWAATVICRAILEFLPPILTATLGLNPALPLQSVLLVGAVCSAAVQLGTFGALAYLLRNQPAAAIASTIAGLLASILCIRIVFKLPAPQAYAPNPVPPWIKSVLLQNVNIHRIEPL